MSDLVERLRERCVDWSGEDLSDFSSPRTELSCKDLREAASLIERQAALIEEAREALRFYAKRNEWEDFAEDVFASSLDGSIGTILGNDMGALAHATLAKLEQEG